MERKHRKSELIVFATVRFTLAVPVESELSTVIVTVFISDLGEWVNREFWKFDEDIELFKIARASRDQINLQRNLMSLSDWAIK